MLDQKLILLAILAATVLFLVVFRYGSTRPANGATSGKISATVALTGAPDAGKTTLFSALAFGSAPKTHTSLTTSTASITVPSASGKDASLALVDLPGHPRMREQTQNALREPKLRGVVFVVDVAALIRNGAMVAEELIPILTTLCARAQSNPSSPAPHILILANKSDLLAKQSQPLTSTSTDTKTRTLAHDRLITLLTRELDRAKASRASATGRIDAIDHIPSASTSSFSPYTMLKRFFGGAAAPTAGTTADESWAVERAEEALWGGRGDGFRFEDVEGVDVEFAVGSAVRGKDGLEEVWDWLGGLYWN